MRVSVIDLWGEIWKPVLKLDFTANGNMESLSEYGHPAASPQEQSWRYTKQKIGLLKTANHKGWG